MLSFCTSNCIMEAIQDMIKRNPTFAANLADMLKDAEAEKETHFELGQSTSQHDEEEYLSLRDYTASSPKISNYTSTESILYTINSSDIHDVYPDVEGEEKEKSQSQKNIMKNKRKSTKKSKSNTEQSTKKKYVAPFNLSNNQKENEEPRQRLTMRINKNVFDEIERNREIQEFQDEKSEKRKQAAKEKLAEKERTLTVFNWKDSHVKCFFKHFKVNETKYKRAEGRMKKYEMWNNIADDLGEELVQNGEHFIPTPAQCESRMKHMKSTYHKYVDESRISGNGRSSKSAYFDEMDDLFGYRPGVNPLATISTTLPSSSSSSSDLNKSSSSASHSAVEEETPKKKRKYVSSTENATNSI